MHTSYLKLSISIFWSLWGKFSFFFYMWPDLTDKIEIKNRVEIHLNHQFQDLSFKLLRPISLTAASFSLHCCQFWAHRRLNTSGRFSPHWEETDEVVLDIWQESYLDGFLVRRSGSQDTLERSLGWSGNASAYCWKSGMERRKSGPLSSEPKPRWVEENEWMYYAK